MDSTAGTMSVRRALRGEQASINLMLPPAVPGSVVVGTFHTHPNPSDDGWDPGPSDSDERIALMVGVPFLIRADNGIHLAGPDSRRGGMSGDEGFPY